MVAASRMCVWCAGPSHVSTLLLTTLLQVLNKDITRVLTTILMATTVCTIYNAALFTNLAIQVRLHRALRKMRTPCCGG